MKKKGLIISSIVMVVVLIASLTTATYAWFTTSAVTKLNDLTVSVQTSNLFKIGMDSDGAINTGTKSSANYRTGQITPTYTAGNAGQLVANAWTGGTQGLSANLDPQIKWSAQTQAIGFSATEIANPAGMTSGLTTLLADPDAGFVYAANGTDGTHLESGKAAVANVGAESSDGDYVFLSLGVAPTTTLASAGEIIVMVDGSQNTNSDVLGILAAIHVAYRVNPAGASAEWTDVDVFGEKHFNDAKTFTTQSWGQTTNTALSAESASGKKDGETDTYVATYTTDSSSPATVPTGAAFVRIPLTKTTANAADIDDVQILIYIDGADADCNNTATVNAGGLIHIFFHGVKAAAQG